MQTFKKYTSIENTFDKGFMEKIELEGFAALQYVVQEKVHGSNTCFVTDGTTVRFAKRTDFVESGEKFYDYEELLERYTEKVLRLFVRVKAKYPDTQTLFVYGEMFGGTYPHRDVKNISKVMTIQKGVFYSPIHEFYGFDLYIFGEENGRYLTVNEINELFSVEDFIYAKTLFQGTLDECLHYPNAFQSRVSEWLGLPPIDDNICEGIVIRPVVPTYLRNGSRVLLKSKNARFAEKKSVKKRQPKLYVEPTYSESLNNLLAVVEEYITENRLNNVISKIGEVSVPRDMGKLIGLLSKDVLEDFLKEHESAYALLEKSEQKILNTHSSKLSTNLIKRVLMGM
ncbi:MAG: RNA ligase, Rnl2 family [Prevotellaceae bacterium]|jgi:Rnl2 family RNA ligase|nr:RNA ligase, Rnl2 family [Prevotellaceae bacterium]